MEVRRMPVKIKPELIPATVAESIGQAALDGFLRFKQHLQQHPEEARRFEERVAEVKERHRQKTAAPSDTATEPPMREGTQAPPTL
jgi:hypothetical protein